MCFSEAALLRSTSPDTYFFVAQAGRSASAAAAPSPTPRIGFSPSSLVLLVSAQRRMSTFHGHRLGAVPRYPRRARTIRVPPPLTVTTIGQYLVSPSPDGWKPSTYCRRSSAVDRVGDRPQILSSGHQEHLSSRSLSEQLERREGQLLSLLFAQYGIGSIFHADGVDRNALVLHELLGCPSSSIGWHCPRRR